MIKKFNFEKYIFYFKCLCNTVYVCMQQTLKMFPLPSMKMCINRFFLYSNHSW